ncbi:MAG: chemotaxis response regulator protein-glutamate methylesterase [Gracilibacter sp. BRH_c7a]|nr:MAG: chemotaxis response regulator protein-glutamate methylesterase [Gracilibacter sp. BRH_c7a]
MNKPLKTIKVLIVDDSPFIRMSLKKILDRDPGIEVVDTARDGREGITKLQALKPDVVTMDVEMPVMNGLQALEEIMRWQPTPIIILSSVTTEGAKLTIKAFDLGAAEVVAKPSGKAGDDLVALAEDLTLKVKSVAGIDPKRLKNRTIDCRGIVPTPVSKPKNLDLKTEPKGTGLSTWPRKNIEVVAIGTSTGGPTALQIVLSKLPKNFPVPVIVSQHMPVGFTLSLASRLDSLSEVKIKQVENDEVLKPGTVYIGEAGKQFQVKKDRNELVAVITTESPINTLYKPSVDVMFMSLAKVVGGGVLGVVMTGMGTDGSQGMQELKNQGAFAIAESETTCIVYGMPRSIVERGLADRIEQLPNIGQAIIDCVNRR